MLYPCKSGWNRPTSSWDMVHTSTFWLKFSSLSPELTLKIGSRSPKPNQLFIMSQCYILANLVKIHQQVHEISCKQESVTPTPTPTPTANVDAYRIRTKNNISPSTSVGDIKITSAYVSLADKFYVIWQKVILNALTPNILTPSIKFHSSTGASNSHRIGNNLKLLQESTFADQKRLKIAFSIAICRLRLPICNLKRCLTFIDPRYSTLATVHDCRLSGVKLWTKAFWLESVHLFRNVFQTRLETRRHEK